MSGSEIVIDRYEWPDLEGTEIGLRYARYRARVYVLERRFRDPDVLDLRGGESDEYDPSSAHFLATDHRSGELIGCVRSIICPDRPLPLQHHFPGALEGWGLERVDCVEVSRFIATPETFRTRRITSLLLIRSVVRDCLRQGRTHTVFIVEEPFARWLERLGVPVEVMAPYRDIADENGVLAPIAVNAELCDVALARAHNAYGSARLTTPRRLQFAEPA